MSSILKTLEEAVHRLELAGQPVLVGVSGGADSVALLRGLHALAPISQLDLHAAHLNHGLRPGAAEEDAEWTRELCGRLGVPLVIEQIDVSLRARTQGLSLEEAARHCRYEFLERCARAVGCPRIAVAHNADDQAETVLHHVLRGSGLAGLRGMRSSRPLAAGITLVRPLLRVRRQAIESWLAEIGQDFRCDETNADETRTRNRLRHVVLPLLEREFGPQVRASLLRLAEQAGQVQSAIEESAEGLLESALEDRANGLVRLDFRPLAAQPRHLVRETFVALWKRMGWPRQAMGLEEWDRLYGLVLSGGTVILPGKIEATRRGSLLVLRRS